MVELACRRDLYGRRRVAFACLFVGSNRQGRTRLLARRRLHAGEQLPALPVGGSTNRGVGKTSPKPGVSPEHLVGLGLTQLGVEPAQPALFEVAGPGFAVPCGSGPPALLVGRIRCGSARDREIWPRHLEQRRLFVQIPSSARGNPARRSGEPTCGLWCRLDNSGRTVVCSSRGRRHIASMCPFAAACRPPGCYDSSPGRRSLQGRAWP